MRGRACRHRFVVRGTSSGAMGVVLARHRLHDWATSRLKVTPSFVLSRGVDSVVARDRGVVSLGCGGPGE